MRGIMITLDAVEKSALMALAIRERRDPRAQAEHMIVRELERLGFLPSVEVIGDDLPDGLAQIRASLDRE